MIDIGDYIYPEVIVPRIKARSKEEVIETAVGELSQNHMVSEDYLESIIRMRDADDIYVQVLHRMFYVASYSNGSIWLALCLYNLFAGTNPRNVIVDSLSGQQTDLVSHNCNDLLTGREKEILKLIDKGKMSKDIASLLSISVKTVSRHRQNILEKLQVNNSIEACRIAKELSLI